MITYLLIISNQIFIRFMFDHDPGFTLPNKHYGWSWNLIVVARHGIAISSCTKHSEVSPKFVGGRYKSQISISPDSQHLLKCLRAPCILHSEGLLNC